MDEMAVTPAENPDAFEPNEAEQNLAAVRHSRAGHLTGKAGLLPRQDIRKLVGRKVLWATHPIEESQYQPASLDLRLGSKAYRVRASFLPGPHATVEEKLSELTSGEIRLDEGAVLEKGCVYVVELLERLQLPSRISALANPKSSTGRLDVFTRLISDRSEIFDTVPGGYQGPLFAEVSPRSFSIRVKRGTRLNQLRFRRRNPNQDESGHGLLSDQKLRELHDTTKLVDGELHVRDGLVLRVELGGIGPERLVGYRAQRHTDILDMENVRGHRIQDYWEPIRAREDGRLILDPNEFYILASKERLHIPPGFAAEMVPIDPLMGEFRVHYAGFFDPGFGFTEHGHPGSRAVLEVRSHEVPFILEDGQPVGRLAYERLAEEPDGLYGQIGTSNYQGQELKLSKHFRMDG
jgi:dCTP deaminase